MKNTHIRNLGQVIDPETRLEVYKELLERSEKDYSFLASNGLCIALPIVLWDLNHYLDNSPDGKFYSYSLTPSSFPELTNTILTAISFLRFKERNDYRIKLLKQWISDLESMISDEMDSYNK